MKKNLLIVATLILVSAVVVKANVVLPDVIAEAMVLQRNQPVPIWGQADPGEVVVVKFAGQSKKVTAGADGKWLVKLDSLKANATPATMTISGKNTIELKNILVGEVWLLAGQSNMQRLLSETANGEAAIAAADQTPALSDTSRAKPAQSASSRPLATVAVSRWWIKETNGIGTSPSFAASKISP